MNAGFRFVLASLLLSAGIIGLPAATTTSGAQSAQGPIVARVQRSNGRTVVSITPDPAPGKDALFQLNLLRQKLGPSHPVVAVVEDDVNVLWLWQVSGIASKAGFDKTRTFIHNRNNGMMFEVTFGPPQAFSMTGPFNPERKDP